MKRPTQFEKVYLYRNPVDMRKAINGLSQIVQEAGLGDWSRAHLFVFTGKRRDGIKILYFDKSGFALWQKRLEKEKFPWPKKHTDSVISITPEQLEWLLNGFDVFKMKPFEELHYSHVC